MQIIIDIPDNLYNNLKNGCGIYPYRLIYEAIVNGTLIPKGYGRLFDEKDIVSGNYEIIGNKIYELEPIIEANEES